MKKEILLLISLVFVAIPLMADDDDYIEVSRRKSETSVNSIVSEDFLEKKRIRIWDEEDSKAEEEEREVDVMIGSGITLGSGFGGLEFLFDMDFLYPVDDFVSFGWGFGASAGTAKAENYPLFTKDSSLAGSVSGLSMISNTSAPWEGRVINAHLSFNAMFDIELGLPITPYVHASVGPYMFAGNVYFDQTNDMTKSSYMYFGGGGSISAGVKLPVTDKTTAYFSAGGRIIPVLYNVSSSRDSAEGDEEDAAAKASGSGFAIRAGLLF